jgi:ABC-2 type transport system ATP-binding protein
MIEVKQLSKYYGSVLAVDSLSFNVRPGEVLGFLGPNGAGKTTTMRMLSGFITPTAGDACIYGNSVCDRPLAAKQHIGYLPEGAPAYGEMTPSGFLSFIADIRGLQRSAKKEAIDSVVAQLQLRDVLAQPIETLSKGFKRRLGLAQALIHDPKILILDEPTDGLDPNQKHEVRQLINEISKDKIIIVSTHILEEVEAVCSRAIIIDNGKIQVDDTPQALVERSRFHNAVTLTFTDALTDDRLQAIANELSELPQAAGAETNRPQRQITVFPIAGKDIIETVNQLSTERCWKPQQIHVERGKLDDVFREVTRS